MKLFTVIMLNHGYQVSAQKTASKSSPPRKLQISHQLMALEQGAEGNISI
jgi:hypothetical protein